MWSDYIGGGGRGKIRTQKSSSAKLVTILTCLQFAFAIYATCLLYYMSPSLDLRTTPDFAWASEIAKQWKQYIITPHVVNRLQESNLQIQNILKPSEVCEQEQIDFLQKKSNDAVMIKLKRELYQEVLDFQSNSSGTETLHELMRMESKWVMKTVASTPKVTVILNHFKRKTLCAQIDVLLKQSGG